MATKKFLTNHGLPILTESVCALWHGIKKIQLCRDEPGNVFMAAVQKPDLQPTAVEIAVVLPTIDGPYL